MKATADSLQFCELTSFAEHEQLQEDIATQTNKNFKFALFKTFSLIRPKKGVALVYEHRVWVMCHIPIDRTPWAHLKSAKIFCSPHLPLALERLKKFFVKNPTNVVY